MVNIHPTAVIENGAQIDDTAEIGPFCWVSARAKIGKNVKLLARVSVMGDTTIGEGSVGSNLILALTLLFFYLPILYIIVFSFNDSRSLTKFGGFSLRWYEKMFA